MFLLTVCATAIAWHIQHSTADIPVWVLTVPYAGVIGFDVAKQFKDGQLLVSLTASMFSYVLLDIISTAVVSGAAQ